MPLARPSVQPSMMAKSKALPFQNGPAHLEGMVGNAGFDPFGLSTPQNIKWMREAELKHGRMCQLAWLGYVAVDCGVKFPGAKYASLTSFGAHDTVVYELFLLLLLVGTSETIGFTQVYQMTEGSDREPGDFGFDPLGLLTPQTEAKYKLAELTHGRLAMLAFSGVVTQSAMGAAGIGGKEVFPYF
jgi:light-harvesting complex I chlorophyll a/b binding protein 1